MSSDSKVDQFGADERKRLRRTLLATGLGEHALIEPLATELRRHYRARKAWRLANGLTLDFAAREYNRRTGRANAPMTASRISEFESWPQASRTGRLRPRPTVDTLQTLAEVYHASWDQLVDTDDLEHMSVNDRAAYCAAVTQRCSTSHGNNEEYNPSRDIAPLIGRQEQRADLQQRVQRHLSAQEAAVYVLCGLAGSGKTTLARHLVDQYADRYPDGWIWEDLLGHATDQSPRSPSEVLEHLLLRIGVPPETIAFDREHRAQRWRSEMRKRRMLIVFDNALDSDQVRDLMPHAPGCFVLITSRRNLTALMGAVPLKLGTMVEADAAALLVELSHLPPDHDSNAVHRIVETAGRLPLAIRLIAGHISHYGPEMLATIDSELQGLRERMKECPTDTALGESPAAGILDHFSAEEETLHAAFELSYRLLQGPELRRTFRLIGCFPGSEITAETLRPMANVSMTEANRLLRRIFEMGLLDPVEAKGRAVRYRIHDVTRLFARVQADREEPPGSCSAAVERLVHYCLTVARGAGPPRLVDTPDFDVAGNLTEFSTTASLEAAEDARTWLTEEREMLLGCVQVASNTAESGKLQRYLAYHFAMVGQWSEGLRLFCGAAEVAREFGDRDEECDALCGVGVMHRLAGNYSEALTNLKQSLAIAVELGDPVRAAVAQWCCAQAMRNMGNYAEAREAGLNALDLARRLQNPKNEGDALRGLGHTERLDGNFEIARRYYEDAMTIAASTGDEYSRGWSLWGLGNVIRATGNPGAAHSLLQEAISIGIEIPDFLLQVDALRGLGHLERDTGDLDAAQGYYSESLVIARANGDARGEADAWQALSSIAVRTGDEYLPRAREFLHRALTIYEMMRIQTADRVRTRLSQLGD